ncbi:MAG: hypothetical protein IKH01_06430 [Prevotella sp.]|nr:hypothetical protein [Prevotella sp.]
MAIVVLTVAQIRECVVKLAQTAKTKIPDFPKETWNVEHHYVSEQFEKDGEQFIFAFKCNPALKNEQMKKMMLCCVVCSPSKGVEMERPIMYEEVNTVVDTIDSEEIISKCINTFKDLLEEAENFDPDDDDRFDFDD